MITASCSCAICPLLEWLQLLRWISSLQPPPTFLQPTSAMLVRFLCIATVLQRVAGAWVSSGSGRDTKLHSYTVVFF